MGWQVDLKGFSREAITSVDACVTTMRVETCTKLSCKKEKNLTSIVGRNQTHSLRDANPRKDVTPKNTATSKLHRKLHLGVILQKDLETHMLRHLVKEQRGQQTRHL